MPINPRANFILKDQILQMLALASHDFIDQEKG